MTVKIDMEMPKSCEKCKFMEFVSSDKTMYWCKITDNWIVRKEGKKSPACPLQEVKE